MAQREERSAKNHGDVLENATDAVPMPEDGGHQRSHAAHLGHVHEQTKPADKIKQGMGSNTLREPPMVVSRVGKRTRG